MEKNYRTKQRVNILKYLKENNANHVTADEIIEYFKKIDNPIGKSTVYRYLDNLVQENIIRRYITPERGMSACFQYIDNEESCNSHYHMQCTNCGALIHLECDEINELSNHILKEHKFKLDTCKTILYGECENCINRDNF